MVAEWISFAAILVVFCVVVGAFILWGGGGDE